MTDPHCVEGSSSDNCPSRDVVSYEQSATACALFAAYPDRHHTIFPLIDFQPAGVLRRQIAAWRDLCGEFVRAIRRQRNTIRSPGCRGAPR